MLELDHGQMSVKDRDLTLNAYLDLFTEQNISAIMAGKLARLLALGTLPAAYRTDPIEAGRKCAEQKGVSLWAVSNVSPVKKRYEEKAK